MKGARTQKCIGERQECDLLLRSALAAYCCLAAAHRHALAAFSFIWIGIGPIIWHGNGTTDRACLRPRRPVLHGQLPALEHCSIAVITTGLGFLQVWPDALKAGEAVVVPVVRLYFNSAAWLCGCLDRRRHP